MSSSVAVMAIGLLSLRFTRRPYGPGRALIRAFAPRDVLRKRGVDSEGEFIQDLGQVEADAIGGVKDDGIVRLFGAEACRNLCPEGFEGVLDVPVIGGSGQHDSGAGIGSVAR